MALCYVVCTCVRACIHMCVCGGDRHVYVYMCGQRPENNHVYHSQAPLTLVFETGLLIDSKPAKEGRLVSQRVLLRSPGAGITNMCHRAQLFFYVDSGD